MNENSQRPSPENPDLALARSLPGQFPPRFTAWLADNLQVWQAFQAEALKVVANGFQHYSARTILHFLRHHTALQEQGGEGWKLNNDHSPYLARLFHCVYPQHGELFELRRAYRREEAEAA
jgi:hypothetical protein